MVSPASFWRVFLTKNIFQGWCQRPGSDFYIDIKGNLAAENRLTPGHVSNYG
jgi:hypothetical protein